MIAKKENLICGFIGCGRWAQTVHLPYLVKLKKHIRLAALSGIDSPSEAKRLVSIYNFSTYYLNWQDMLENEKLDVVVITTPHSFHYKQVRDSISHGCNVIVDKPPALTAVQLQDLIRLSELNRKTVFVVSQRRYWREYQYTRRLINDGTLGDIKAIQGIFGQKIFEDFWSSWRADPELCGGGITVDTGYHLIDTILYMVQPNKPKFVTMFANSVDKISDTHCSINFTLDSGCVASLMIVRGFPKNFEQEEIKLIGERGMVILRREKSSGNSFMCLKHFNELGDVIHNSNRKLSIVEKTLPISMFVNALLTGDVDNITTITDSLNTVALIEAAYESWYVNRTMYINH